MRLLRNLFRRVRGLVRAETIHREIDEEARFHIEMRIDENIRRGMSPEEARLDAERRFGNLTRMKERGYEVRGGSWLETLWQDLRYGVRMLLKNPGFTLIAVITLALGIGATTTMFSVVYNILFSPFTYREPARISDLMIQDLENPRAGERGALIVPEFLDYLERSTIFQEVFGSIHGSVIDTSNGGSEQLGVSWVTPNAFNF